MPLERNYEFDNFIFGGGAISKSPAGEIFILTTLNLQEGRKPNRKPVNLSRVTGIASNRTGRPDRRNRTGHLSRTGGTGPADVPNRTEGTGPEHCFVTSEAPFRFPEVILVPIEPQKRDLQLWNCPRASAKQGGCLFGELPCWNVFANVWWIWDLVLSPVRRH